MKLADTARRAISVVLAAACFVVVPSIATAAFTDRTSVSGSVGTAVLKAPTAIQGTYACDLDWAVFVTLHGVTVTPTGVTAANRDVVRYRFELLDLNRNVEATIASTSPTGVQMEGDVTRGPLTFSTTWTIRARAEYHTWTSPWFEKTFTCSGTTSSTPIPR